MKNVMKLHQQVFLVQQDILGKPNFDLVCSTLTWAQFYQYYSSHFYAPRSQKQKKTIFCAFGICVRKSYS